MESEKRPKTTSASRMKKMREKQKASDRAGFLEKERRRIAELRKRKQENMTDKDKDVKKRYERDRKRLQRARKLKVNQTPNGSDNTSECTTPTTPFSCKQTLSKAVLKTVRALPKSPRKQKAVIHGLVKRLGVELGEKLEANLVEKLNDDYTIVTDFYFRPDIVYTCPGMKDCITIWKDGKKEKLQKHFMTMFLREAFYVFKEQYQNVKIGFSKFCSLRPKNVLLLKDTPSEQCKCKIHENFMLKLKALKYQYGSDFWKSVLCNDNINSSCWQNTCEQCSGGKLLLLPTDPESKITWKEWVKNEDGRIKLSVKEDCIGDVYDKLIADLPKMMAHVNIKRIQHEEFESDKANATKRLLQIDFAMSFSCEYQNEIQSALWSRTSVMLFTSAFFYDGECKTYVICSDSKNKDKDSIYIFLDLLYDDIFRKNKGKQYEEVIWSDGPSSEFKNKFMVKTLQVLSEKYKRNFTWKYFATSHGKGIVDGIGGNVKRLVRMKMMSQGEGSLIQSAKDFAEVASKVCSKTQVFYVGADHIEETITKETPWDNVPAVPRILSFHVIYCANNRVSGKKHARHGDELNLGPCLPAVQKKQPAEFKEGQWVLVKYEQNMYPGEITEIISKDQLKVSVMVPTGAPGHYKWPVPPDCIVYDKETEVLKIISPPTIVNSRGLYKLNREDLEV